jgi:hypothetical protein
MFFSGLNLFSQATEFPKIMYVNSKEGLRLRLEPSINSNIIGIVLHGERIRIYEKSSTLITIDGITDYWYRTDGKYYEGKWYSSAWVFGGYLTEKLPEDVSAILGYWDVVGKNRNYYNFRPDYTFTEGYKETDRGFYGTWSINGNILTIIITRPIMDSDEIVEYKPETIKINLIINNRDDIILNYPNGEIIKLVRNNGLI